MSNRIAHSAVILAGVEFGQNVVVEDFCLIGTVPASLDEDSSLPTIIGSGAVVRSHVVIYAGNRIGNNVRIGNKANIRELNIIGDDVSIGSLSVIEHHVTIENAVRIHSQVFIPEFSVIKAGAWIGPNVVLTNAKYPNSPTAKASLRGPIIEEGARIGANATILPGVTIGKNSLVGAGSVVTKDVPENAVVVGNPARIVNYIDKLPYVS